MLKAHVVSLNSRSIKNKMPAAVLMQIDCMLYSINRWFISMFNIQKSELHSHIIGIPYDLLRVFANMYSFKLRVGYIGKYELDIELSVLLLLA